jgi:RNA polymerase sigma-70 factor (ECF subfamily)
VLTTVAVEEAGVIGHGQAIMALPDERGLSISLEAEPVADSNRQPDPTPPKALPGKGNDPRLSASGRVHPSVSSIAMDPILPRSGAEAARGAAGRRSAGLRVTSPVDYEALDDAQVMLRVKNGDDAGFEYLVTKYRRPMMAFMYRMAHNTAVAEELAQEIFLRVYRSRQTYNAEAKFSTWLYRIATNLAVNHARDTKYERPEITVNLDQPDQETGSTIDLPDGSMTAEQAILRRERLAAIRQHVQNLPERQRLAVLMHKYQEMDYRQIGEVLKLSESATKSLLFRAYETLREKLKDFI